MHTCWCICFFVPSDFGSKFKPIQIVFENGFEISFEKEKKDPSLLSIWLGLLRSPSPVAHSSRRPSTARLAFFPAAPPLSPTAAQQVGPTEQRAHAVLLFPRVSLTGGPHWLAPSSSSRDCVGHDRHLRLHRCYTSSLPRSPRLPAPITSSG